MQHLPRAAGMIVTIIEVMAATMITGIKKTNIFLKETAEEITIMLLHPVDMKGFTTQEPLGVFIVPALSRTEEVDFIITGVIITIIIPKEAILL
jgi:hypothetical protein